MRVGIIGAGVVGTNVAKHLASAGHSVALSNSRGPETLTGLIAQLGQGVQALQAADAAGFGDVVFITAPWRALRSLPEPSTVAAKTVVDATNPYDCSRRPILLPGITSSEVVASRYASSRVVKGLNTLPWWALRDGPRPRGHPARLAVPLAGDDAEALMLVGQLIDDMGFDPVVTGSLREGGRLQGIQALLYGVATTAEEMCQLLQHDESQQLGQYEGLELALSEAER